MIECVKRLHEKGYIHLDIKLDNFGIDNGKVYLLDFGISKEYIKNGKHIEF